MSKEVTRTITRTVISYIAVDVSGEPYDGSTEVTGKFDQEQAQKYITKKGIIGRVTNVNSVEVIWGITEEDFLKYGHEVTRPASQTKKPTDAYKDNVNESNN